jgi:hypothetical protein
VWREEIPKPVVAALSRQKPLSGNRHAAAAGSDQNLIIMFRNDSRLTRAHAVPC